MNSKRKSKRTRPSKRFYVSFSDPARPGMAHMVDVGAEKEDATRTARHVFLSVGTFTFLHHNDGWPIVVFRPRPERV